MLILYLVWFAQSSTLLSVICVSYMWTSLGFGSLRPKILPTVANWGNSIAWGGIGDYLADDGLGTPVAQGVNCVPLPCAAICWVQ